MSDRPIIFSAPMIRALLDGRKTQTRRLVSFKQMHPVMKTTPHTINLHDGTLICRWNSGIRFDVKSPYAPGDRIWVREGFVLDPWDNDAPTYRADGERIYDNIITRWKPSIHMPRRVSRLTLTVTDVRVQRLQEINEDDAISEGCRGYVSQCGDFGESPFEEFRALWNSLHGPDAWDANPWVVALTFDVHRCNIDQMDAA